MSYEDESDLSDSGSDESSSPTDTSWSSLEEVVYYPQDKDGDDCECGPDIYSALLGPTADEPLLVLLELFLKFAYKCGRDIKGSIGSSEYPSGSSDSYSSSGSGSSASSSSTLSNDLPGDNDYYSYQADTRHRGTITSSQYSFEKSTSDTYIRS